MQIRATIERIILNTRHGIGDRYRVQTRTISERTTTNIRYRITYDQRLNSSFPGKNSSFPGKRFTRRELKVPAHIDRRQWCILKNRLVKYQCCIPINHMQVRQTRATGECTTTYTIQGCWQLYRSQAGATVERIFTNTRQARGKLNRSQAGAIIKRIFTNTRQGKGQLY